MLLTYLPNCIFLMKFSPSLMVLIYLPNGLCMIKIFRGEGVVDGEGGSSERCLKWGGGGSLRDLSKNILK